MDDNDDKHSPNYALYLAERHLWEQQPYSDHDDRDPQITTLKGGYKVWSLPQLIAAGRLLVVDDNGDTVPVFVADFWRSDEPTDNSAYISSVDERGEEHCDGEFGRRFDPNGDPRLI